MASYIVDASIKFSYQIDANSEDEAIEKVRKEIASELNKVPSSDFYIDIDSIEECLE